MSGKLPDYYFRVRENGALVFRVDTENRQRRIEIGSDRGRQHSQWRDKAAR